MGSISKHFFSHILRIMTSDFENIRQHGMDRVKQYSVLQFTLNIYYGNVCLYIDQISKELLKLLDIQAFFV